MRTILCTTVALTLTSLASAQVSPYSQDFEGLVQTDPMALGNDGWLVGANVFDPTGVNFLYNYFAFPAPNGGPAFSGIDIGQGGPDQGMQQLVVYNDYNNGDHNIGNQIEANVFQEQNVGAGDVGKTWVFTFDAKLGNLTSPTAALAFIKILDPMAGFSASAFEMQDMTNTPATWSTYMLSTTISASQVGHIFQIGFLNTAANFDPSGIFYDNIVLEEAMAGLGTNYCVASPNSQGAGGATMSASGSTSVAANDLVLSCGPVEAGQPGIFFYSDTQAANPNGFAFGEGVQCIIGGGTGVIRVLPPSLADMGGTLTKGIDNTNPIQGAGIMVGATANFQGWYRDPNCPGMGGSGDCNNDGADTGFNTSDAYSITFTM